MMALVLVTGVAGFIGSHVARALASAGHDVIGSDRLRDGGKWRNLLGVRIHDLIAPDALADWLAAHQTEIARVVHLGAVSDTTETDADRVLRNNVRLSLDLWRWCARHGVPFVYASSAATYGDGAQGFEDSEERATLERYRPLNVYGWSKQLVDIRIVSDVQSGRQTPPQWAGLKLFNVYGPHEDHKGHMRSLITKIIPLVKAGGSVKLFKSYDPNYGDGLQMRDFVYVDDVVSVIEWLACTPSVSGLFIVGSGVARTWNDVVRVTSDCLGQPTRIEYVDMPSNLRSQYQYVTKAPLEKLRLAGWTGRATSLEQGVADYLGSAVA